MNLTFFIYIIIIISIIAYSVYEEKSHSKEQIKSIENYLNSNFSSSKDAKSLTEPQVSLINKNNIATDHDFKKQKKIDHINNSNIDKKENNKIIKEVEPLIDNIVTEKANDLEKTIEFPQKKLTQKKRNSSDYNRKEIGELGENLVYSFLEKNKINSDELFHESKINGNHNVAGYDIKFISNNTEYLIEVKSTKGPIYNRIILTSNEVNKMENCGNSIYCIYRVYDVDLEKKTGKLIRLIGKKQINDFLIREGINKRKVSFREV